MRARVCVCLILGEPKIHTHISVDVFVDVCTDVLYWICEVKPNRLVCDATTASQKIRGVKELQTVGFLQHIAKCITLFTACKRETREIKMWTSISYIERAKWRFMAIFSQTNSGNVSKATLGKTGFLEMG